MVRLSDESRSGARSLLLFWRGALQMFASFLSQHLGGDEVDQVLDKIWDCKTLRRCLFTSLLSDDLK